MAEIGPNIRLRVSPSYQATLNKGVTAFAPFNQHADASVGDPPAEYHRLVNGA